MGVPRRGHCASLRADQVRGYDALLVLAPRVTAATLEGADRLAIVARFGVGYDSVDVAACSRNGVLLTITPDGVRRPVATAAMAFLLALSHKLLIKDRLTRQGRWSEKLDHMGMGLTGRTLGVIGLGNIGRELCGLARPFGMRLVAFDPHVEPDAGGPGRRRAGVPGGPPPRVRLRLRLLRPDARDPPPDRCRADRADEADRLPDQRRPRADRRPGGADRGALRTGAIQGAGLDVFETEPVDPKDPILALENVILAPHALCWTDECFRGNGVSACESILDVAAGRIPGPVVNRDVIGHPLLVEKLRRIARGREDRMRDNRVKQTLAAGGVSVGTMMIEFNTTGIARIAAEAGAEFAVFDMEHTGWSMERSAMLMATSRAADLVPLVRPPTSQYHFIARGSTSGRWAWSPAGRRRGAGAARSSPAAKYPPAGRRGCAFAVAHDDFQGGDLAAKMGHTNDNVLIIAQIETAEGLENVEEIAAVDGIDALWIGQFDLTASLGSRATSTSPVFRAATRRVVDACHAHGKAAVLAVMDVDELCAGPGPGLPDAGVRRRPLDLPAGPAPLLPCHPRVHRQEGCGSVVISRTAPSSSTAAPARRPRPGRCGPGPLSVVFESGDLRYVRLGDREVVRRIYVAVRDRNWGTVPARLADVTIEERPDRFLIRYVAEHAEGPDRFRLAGRDRGRPRRLAAVRDGRRRPLDVPAQPDRVLRPPPDPRVRGCPLPPDARRRHDARRRVPAADRGPEPVPRADRAVARGRRPGVWAELRFEGDVFETEDQRNWIDGSFKTFCTPLRLPFPVEIAAGDPGPPSRLADDLGAGRPIPPIRAARSRSVSQADSAVPLPEIGLGQPPDGHWPSASQVDLLRRLNPSHLRADLDLGRPGWRDLLGRALDRRGGPRLLPRRRRLGGGRGVAERDAAARRTWRRPDGIGSAAGSSSHEAHGPPRPRWWSGARRILGPIDGRIPLVAGTLANFLELNRARLPWEQLGRRLLLGPPAGARLRQRVAGREPGGPGLGRRERPRAGPGASGRGRPDHPPEARESLRDRARPPSRDPGELPARVDPRQMSLFGAGWTLGAIKHLAEQRAARATFYETTGWLGVMESEAGPPLPERFPSRPGQVFPMYHVFADVNEFRGGEVLPSRSNSPPGRRRAGASPGRSTTRILLANFTPQRSRDRGRRPGESGADPHRSTRRTPCRTPRQPVASGSEPGSTRAIVGGRYELALGPYALARLDTE